jgi:hypothetical protein
MRAYHFVSSQYAFDNLRHRRLKIAQLDELNDPFELWAISQHDRRVRQALRRTKERMARQYGVLCFSLYWHNPLLWSHYGDRHRGIALGFDVADAILEPVSYVEQRPALKKITPAVANWLLFTKYADWQYEREARVFTRLTDRDPGSGLYFAGFSEQLVLREVITGPLNTNMKREVLAALGSPTGVTFTKSRLAFKSFQVVKDRRGLGR